MKQNTDLRESPKSLIAERAGIMFSKLSLVLQLILKEQAIGPI